jgi:hypothetical protein
LLRKKAVGIRLEGFFVDFGQFVVYGAAHAVFRSMGFEIQMKPFQ